MICPQCETENTFAAARCFRCAKPFGPVRSAQGTQVLSAQEVASVSRGGVPRSSSPSAEVIGQSPGMEGQAPVSPPLSTQGAGSHIEEHPDAGVDQVPSRLLQWSYCLVVLAAVTPFGLGKSGWIALAIGGAGFAGLVPFLGPFVLLALGLYRVYVVITKRRVLTAPRATGLAAFLRSIGTLCIYVGVVTAVLSWTARPLMRMLLSHQTESGAEFFVVGVYLGLAGGIGILGLLLFEFSRLLAFERHTAQAIT